MSEATIKTGMTNAGLSILAQAQLGAKIQFTKLKIGDGYLSASQDPKTLTDLINVIDNLAIAEWSMSDDTTIKVTGLVVQGELGYNFREIGLFAIDPSTNQEVLYAYGNKGENATYIPNNTSGIAVEEQATIITKVASADSVVMQIVRQYGTVYYDAIGTHNDGQEVVLTNVDGDRLYPKTAGYGIPPSNCYKLKIEKTDISFNAWKNTNGDVVLTTSATPTASDKIFTQNGDVFTQADNVVTSYDSETTSIVVNEVTYTRESASDKQAVKNELNWCDPQDTVIENQLCCTWQGTKLVRKANEQPTNQDDGFLVVDLQVRNKHANAPVVEYLTTDSDWEYSLFPYSTNGVYCISNRNQFGSTWVFGYEIIGTNSNSKMAVRPLEDNLNYKSVNMNFTDNVFEYNSWVNSPLFDKFVPVMLKKDGTVGEYLLPDDYTLQKDGSTPSHIADVTYDGDGMCQVGQLWVSRKKYGGKYQFRVSNKKINNDYECLTHKQADGSYTDFYYRSLYDCCLIDGKNRSISGKAPNVNTAGNTQIANSKANGDGYNVDELNFRLLLNDLLVLIGGSLNTQDVFGTGRHSGGTQNGYNQVPSGTLDKMGMFWGDNNNGAVKVFGIENWWGNVWKITNGLILYNGQYYYKGCESTQDGSTIGSYPQTDVTGMIPTGITIPTVSQCYIKEQTFVEGLGLLPINTSGGSSTTYYGDGLWANASGVMFARFGCCSVDGFLVGAFALHVYYPVSSSFWYYGVALSYKKPLSGG